MTADTQLPDTAPSASAASVRDSAGDAPALATRGLTKRFRGGQVAVDHIDLLVPHGAVFGFLGPNGSGKTTTIRMLLGLIRPTAGEFDVLGRPMPGAARDVLPRVGALVEGPAFHPYLSGRANLARLDAGDRTVDPRTSRRRIGDALERVGLAAAAGKRYRNYSLGMRQRLGLAARPAASARPAGARRADERPRPAGHPRGADPGPGARGRGQHRLRLLPPAVRDRADLLARRRDEPRAAGHAGHARQSCATSPPPGSGSSPPARTTSPPRRPGPRAGWGCPRPRSRAGRLRHHARRDARRSS